MLRAWLTVVFLVGVVGLVLVSPPRQTADATEYILLATAFGVGRFPSLVPSGDVMFLDLDGLDRSGRQQVWHFWFYPLLASPFVVVGRLVGLSALWGFRLANRTLLVVTFWAPDSQHRILSKQPAATAALTAR